MTGPVPEADETMATDRERVTDVLRRIDLANAEQANELLNLVYHELKALAAQQLRRERADHTLQPTGLVHEAYLKLVDGDRVDFQGRRHFFGIAARAMRQVLVDYARRRDASKRGGAWERITLSDELAAEGEVTADLLELHEALERLSAQHERLGRLVELRFFGGLTLDDAAEELGVSRRTAAKDWSVARLWLHRELGSE